MNLRMLQGVGRKLTKLLRGANIHTVEDYLNASAPLDASTAAGVVVDPAAAVAAAAALEDLRLDATTRRFLDQACRGVDTRPVKADPGFRRSFSVEDSLSLIHI